jgi:hypothetical protein
MEQTMPDRPSDPAEPDRVVVSTTEARQGVTFGRMRWVLGISLAAVIVIFLIAYLAV